MTFLTAKFIFASHQEHLSQETSVSTQSYRRIDFSHRIWNLISSQNTEEVSIAKNTPNLGIVECGLACHKKSDCGGILYDNSSRSCVMKSVTRRRLKFKSPIFDCFKFACLGNLTISPQPQDTIGPYVKSERLSSCSGYEYGGDKKYASRQKLCF